MQKQLSLNFLTFVLSIIVFMPGCSSHSAQTLKNIENRLSSLEDTQYNFQARQESVNEWESQRITALEAKHPDIKVPTPLPFVSREAIRTSNATEIIPPTKEEVIDVTSGKAVVAPSTLAPKASMSQWIDVYGSPTKTTATAPQPQNTYGQQTTQVSRPAPTVITQPTPPTFVVTYQAQVEAFGGRPIDPNAQVTPLKSGSTKKNPQKIKKPKTASGGEKGTYSGALAQIERGQNIQGRASMDSFMAKYPSSKLMPNALYWKGESYYGEQKYDEAILSFKDVLSHYPKSGKTPDAMLKIGMSYKKMGDYQNARFYLQLILTDYPTVRSARIAKKQLASLS